MYFVFVFARHCIKWFILFFVFINFIGVTLVNKIIQVSGAQFYLVLSISK